MTKPKKLVLKLVTDSINSEHQRITMFEMLDKLLDIDKDYIDYERQFRNKRNSLHSTLRLLIKEGDITVGKQVMKEITPTLVGYRFENYFIYTPYVPYAIYLHELNLIDICSCRGKLYSENKYGRCYYRLKPIAKKKQKEYVEYINVAKSIIPESLVFIETHNLIDTLLERFTWYPSSKKRANEIHDEKSKEYYNKRSEKIKQDRWDEWTRRYHKSDEYKKRKAESEERIRYYEELLRRIKLEECDYGNTNETIIAILGKDMNDRITKFFDDYRNSRTNSNILIKEAKVLMQKTHSDRVSGLSLTFIAINKIYNNIRSSITI